MSEPGELYHRVEGHRTQGVPRDGHGVLRSAASSFFATAEQVRADPDLAYAGDPAARPPNMIFLGVPDDAEVKEVRDAYGRRRFYVERGKPIGYADDRHIISVAGSRGGKSRAALIANLANYPGSMVVIDPKGDLAHRTANIRRDKHRQRVFTLDPFGVSGIEKSASYNPVAELTNSSRIQEDAGLIADALVADADGERDPHWNESARMYLEGVVMLVATHPDYQGRRHLPEVAEVIRNALAVGVEEVIPDEAGGTDQATAGEPKQARRRGYFVLQRQMQDAPGPAGPFIAYAGSSFYEKADRERDSVLSTLRRHLKFLTYPSMAEVLKSTSEGLRLADLRTKGREATIYLTLPAMRMGTCRGWLRLFVNMTLNAMENAAVPEAERAKDDVLIVLDEFAVLGKMRELEAAAGQIAGFGCKLWVVIQDLTQIKTLYGQRWETFMGNAGIVQFFANSDLATLDWISRRCGQTTVERQSRAGGGLSARDQGSGHGDSEAEGALLSIEEAARMLSRDGPHQRQLVILPDRPPILLKRIYFDKGEPFREVRKIAPLAGRRG